MASYPKRTKSTCERSSKPHKRKFHGNRFVKKKDDEELGTSSSEQKLSTASSEDILVNPLHCYRIIEFLTVFQAIAGFVICESCKQKIQFQESGHRGLGFKIIVLCMCGRREIHSGPLVNTGYEINRRIVFVMRLLGVGQEGINVFCGLMDLCQGLANSTYCNIVKHILSASESMFNTVTEKAVKEERKKNRENGNIETNLTVSGDASWKKRGFSSLYGVTTLTGHYSGKVVDLIVKSAYCHSCMLNKKSLGNDEFENWYETHKESCSANHQGSAGKMELDYITEMFLRSENKFGVKYTQYIGDGDSKTFAGILKTNPYGDDCLVKKKECVGHVQKRMGTRLRNIKKKEKLGGRSRLTDGVIKKLTIYYGLAIRRNVDSVQKMKEAIMATLDHYSSTDEAPRHEHCPVGVDSWCAWRKAQSVNQLQSFKHPDRLITEEVETHIRSIYEDLSNNDHLTRCLGGFTQNCNESFNATIWLITPKHLPAGQKIVAIAAYLSTGLYNEGYSAILHVMQLLNITIGQQCKMFADIADAQRIERANKRQTLSSKEARTARRLAQMHETETFQEIEGLIYGPGIPN